MNNRIRSYWLTILFGLCIGSLITVIHFSRCDLNEACLRILIRWSAKISAALFAVAFGASSANNLLKSNLTADILKFRPHLGLLFGVSHTFHLFFLIWLQGGFHAVFDLAKATSLLGGGLAYLLMYAMMITTFPRFKTALTAKQWKSLHLVGGYWIWFVFFRSYALQVMNLNSGHFLLFVLVIVFAIRMYHLWHTSNRA